MLQINGMLHDFCQVAPTAGRMDAERWRAIARGRYYGEELNDNKS